MFDLNEYIERPANNPNIHLLRDLKKSVNPYGLGKEWKIDNKGETMNKKIYISGGISGVKHYKKHFAKAEKLLIEKGYEVVNPVKVAEKIAFKENTTVKKQYGIIMIEVLKALLDGCTHIYLLKEWHIRSTIREWKAAKPVVK